MIAAFVSNPRLQVLTIAVLIVAGLGALSTLPRTEDPRVLNRVAVVLTPFPGATAERVEAQVSEPLENALQALPEVKTIESKSQPGLSVVRIELKDSVTETQAIWSRARDKVNDMQAELPPGALLSRFDDERGYAYTRLIALRWQWPQGAQQTVTSERELAILTRYAEELQTRLRGVSGSDLVSLYGAPEAELQLTLKPAQTAALGLSPADIAKVIGRADAKVAAGTLHNERNRLQVEVAGELDSLQRIRQIPLQIGSGEAIRVGDVATLERSVKNPPDEFVLIADQPVLVVAARMLPDLRIDRWSQRVDTVLAEFEQLLPGNIVLDTLFDQQRYTDARLGGLLFNVLIGFALIFAVLLLTLGLRAALIVALALPLTVLFTLACMRFFGLPIHQMSVTGLVVALGIMVDNAIVMTDSIQRKRQQGAAALAAVLDSVRHLWLPLAGSTLTTILAFAPIALMPGPAGEFVGGIALSVMFALTGSYLISHTLIAGLAGKLLPAEASIGRWRWRGIRLPWLARGFAAVLRQSLQHPVLSVLIVFLLPLAGFIAAAQLTEQFFPPSERDMFHIEMRLAPQSSLANTRTTAEQIGTVLDEYREQGLQSVYWFIGNSAPSFYYNMLQNQDGVPYFAQAMVKVADVRAANRLIPILQRRLDDEFPAAQTLVRKLEQGPPFNAPLELRVYGPNLDELRRLGGELRRLLFSTEDIVHSRATLAGGTPKVWLRTRDEVAQLAGLSLTQLAGQLQGALDGVVQGSVLEGTEELPIRIWIGPAVSAQPSDLASLVLATTLMPSAEEITARYPGVPVTALGDLDVQPAWGLIPRRNGQRVNVIEGYIRAGVLPQAVLERFQSQLAASAFVLPAGYRLEVGGESAGRNDAVGNLLSSVGLIVTLLLVVVVLSFNSFRLSAIIFLVAVQSAGLGLLSVYAFGYPFGFTVIVGLLGLMGLAINAAIVILAELKADLRAAEGDIEAIIKGVMSTTRHISSTTITTVSGFMPLILAGGGFWPPFAIAIAGGTVLTTLLSFFFVPALFRVFARRRSFVALTEPVSASA